MNVRLTIDGLVADADDEGVSVLELARRRGIEIPSLCDRDGQVNGVCRLCMVEVEGTGHVVAACSTRVREGMNIRTSTPHLDGLRRVIVSLLMKGHGSHPGETASRCELHDYARRFGCGGVVTGEDGRADSTHPAILFDPSLCILCRRCVIACGEEQVNEVIGLSGKGLKATIGFDLGVPLGASGCVSCGACVDACPTGAFTEKGWRPAERKVVTTCPYCGVGCTVEYGIAGDRIVWARGVEDGSVNGGMLCVKGKFAFQHEHDRERLLVPLVRREGLAHGPLDGRPVEAVFREASWSEALALVADRIRTIRDESGSVAIGGIACDRSTNEDVFAFQKFMRAAVGSDNVDQSATLCHAPSAAMLSWALGTGASTNPVEDVENAKTILVVGSNTERTHPIVSSFIKRAAMRGAHLVVVDPRRVELAERAELVLNLRPGTDVVLFSAIAKHILEMGWQDRRFIDEQTEGFEEWVECLRPFTVEFASRVTGVPASLIREAAMLYAVGKPSLILWTLGITEHENGSDNVSSLINLALLTGNIGRKGTGLNPLRGQNNVQGGADMGATAGSLPGYQPYFEVDARGTFESRWRTRLPTLAGWKSTEMMDMAKLGILRLLYISGENSVRSHPDSGGVASALKKLDFLVVQDIFLTETAEYADVVLPAASSFEKSGTFTNTERRIQAVRPLFPPPGQARADWEVYTELAKMLGYDMKFESSEEIMDEIASLVPLYAGVRHTRLQGRGLQWPVPSAEHPGTAVLHEGGIMRGRGRFRPVTWREPDRAKALEYPYVLITGRQREQYHTATMTRRSPVVNAVAGGPCVEMNPEDMAAEGIGDGESVRVTSPSGSLEASARPSSALTRGVMFTTFHYSELPANMLTSPVFDGPTRTPAYKDTRVRVQKLE